MGGKYFASACTTKITQKVTQRKNLRDSHNIYNIFMGTRFFVDTEIANGTVLKNLSSPNDIETDIVVNIQSCQNQK